MRKLGVWIVIFSMIFSIFSFYPGTWKHVKGASSNKEALNVAVRFHRINYNEYDEKMESWKIVPWMDTPEETWWGRSGFEMPNAQLAKDPANPTVNVPATASNGLFTRPTLWAKFYMKVTAKGGMSQESDIWYAVLDDAGQLWFDPDGAFHDPRYYAYADLADPNYIPGSCAYNPQTQVDPIPGNNTQGPYILDPSYFYNERDPNPYYRGNIFFWDNRRGGLGTKRFWKLGWVDYTDFDVNTAVKQEDWDVGLSVVRFRDNRDGIVDQDEEYHVDLLTTFNGVPTNAGKYDYGEFIYQKGSGNTALKVQVGDLRETYVVIRDSRGENVTYEPLTLVATYDLDLGLDLVSFTNTSIPITDPIGPDEEVHTDFGLRAGFYDLNEFIYRKVDLEGDGLVDPVVSTGDIRLTPVNGRRDPETGKLLLGGIWAGDLLVLSEVLEGGCNSPTYDINIESDIWLGTNPSVVSARLRSPTGDILSSAQDLQKATVLDPDGSKFVIPVTTFHDIRLGYREYIGFELFKDDGVNNLFVTSLTDNKAIPNNLSDDYKEKTTSEEYLGTKNGSPDLDYGRSLTPFPSSVLYYDVSGDGNFGVGEGIYKKKFGSTLRQVEPGDIRLSDVRYDVSGNRINFKASTTVSEGDADLGLPLRRFAPNVRFYDEMDPWNSTVPPNLTYDPWEDIYRIGEAISEVYKNIDVPLKARGLRYEFIYVDFDNDNHVSAGDIRLFRVDTYEAGSIVRLGDSDYGSPYAILPGGGTQLTIGVTEDSSGNPEFVYADIDVSGTVTPNDIRLTPVRDYSSGTVVSPLDSDAEEGKTFTVTAFICVTFNNVVYADVQAPNTQVDEEDIPLTPYLTTAGIYRLSEVTIDNVKYDAGSRVSAGNVFLRESIPHMLRMGANGDKRFFDMAVIPGKLGMDVKFSTPLTVERTTEVTVKFSPAPTKNEKILVYFYDLDNFDTASSFVDIRVATATDPVVTLQFTPYRGSLDDSGQYGQRYFRVQAFKLEDFPIGFGENSRLIKPPDGLYIDPFWESQIFRIGRLSLEAQIEYRYPLYLPTPLIPPFPVEYQNIYDCFEEQKYPVQSATLSLIPDKKCLTLYEQRQPSLSVGLYDPDDPLDVNDPYSIPISTLYGSDALYYFNVHGGGIQWLFTAYIDQAGVRKGIVQVNYDNTYFYWEWNDMGYNNMLDAADTLNYLGQGGPGRLIDQDCTEGTGVSKPDCGFGDKENKLPPFGDVTFGDTFAGYRIMTYGVPVHISNYALEDPGGRALIVARPITSETPVEITVYSKEMIYDYNSSILHPPYFIRDFSQGIDYCGSVRINVLPADPVLNFVEVNWVDHALQYSKINYNQGPAALSRMEVPPMPFIQSRYDPILFEWQTDLRSYPGGQTHTGRVKGKVSTDVGLNDTGRGSGFNAYPAAWSRSSAKKRFTSNYDYSKEWQYEQYEKLGTEFYPLSDYGMFFILKNYDNEHYSFFRNQNRPDLLIKRITIKGPFMRPKILGIESQGHLTSLYNKYNELSKVPVQYDYSGEIVVDDTNWQLYEASPLETAGDFSNITNPRAYVDDRVSYTYNDWNPLLQYNKRLNYTFAAADARLTHTPARGFTTAAMQDAHCNAFVFDEIIPINRGKISITVELQNGVIRTFEDCCGVKEDGFVVHALDLKVDKTQFLPDTDNKIRVTIGEYEPKGYDPAYTDTIKECNNAVIVVWQDRGVYNSRTKSYDGAGDGWITRPPRSSTKTELGFQYDKEDDANGDGKVSFGDFETEICGTYDLATNTWTSGIIDARTWNRNDGTYDLEFSENLNNQITTVGFDFGGGPIKGNISPPDHVISNDELLPVIINAYKYGDDNNDRGFTPFYDVYKPYQFSHEVYLSAQTKIDVTPSNDLIVSASPIPLTAGTTPELVDPQSPLTITVLDTDGNPVDLSYGIPDSSGERIISDDTILNKLIFDPHPDNRDFYGKNARLPQYYWLRTDLQNNDETSVCNKSLYSDGQNPFAPIEIDFREKDNGKYIFKGFCANDEGSFDVFVFTPDRKHIGKTTVKVVLPDVSYKVINVDDPAGREFDVPSEPDFTLTAGDNRLYRITAYVKNAQGIPMKGAGSDISVCGGSATETARFTILSTAPYNFAWAYEQPDATTYRLSGKSYYFISGGDSQSDSFAPLRVGIDYNRNGNVDEVNKEIIKIGGFRAFYYNYLVTTGDRFYDYGHWTYYNTKNWMWDDGRFETYPLHLIYPEPAVDKWERYWYPTTSIKVGYGLGAIYNSPHRGGYCFVDIDNDKKLTYRDSLNLDKEGKVVFYLYAEDIASVGGLIGNNRYSNNEYSSDLYGNPVEYSALSPQNTDRRFLNKWQSYSYYYKYLVTTGDYTFKLDWDAMPNRYLELKPPSVDLYDAETSVALGKDILSKDAYDLSYGKSNSILIRAYPADRRDLPLQDGASIVLDSEEYFPLSVAEKSIFGPQHETTIYGNIYSSVSDPNAKETIITYTPTGFGEEQAYLQYWNRNTRFIYPNFYMVGGLASLDVAKGLTIEIRTDEILKSGVLGRLIIYAKEAGSKAPVPGAKITISGAGVSDSKIADAEGKAEFSITPKAKGVVVVKAEMEGMITGTRLIGVEEDVTPQFIDLDPFDIIPEENSVIISGKVKPGSVVTINNEPVSVDENGRFKYTGKLYDTFTTFEIIAKDPTGKVAKKVITIEKPSANLTVLLDLPDKLIEAKEFTVKGRVVREKVTENNPNRAIWVFVNGVEAKVVPDAKYVEFNFEATVPVSYGKNRIEINVRTAEGYAKKIFEIDNYHRTTIELQIDNDVAYVDGNPKKIDAKPYISNGRTFVPLRIIAEGFGAEVIWVPETKGINITLGERVISMQIGSTKAIINNKVVNLDAPPEIKDGRTFVPIRFVSEALGATVDWNEKTRTVMITRLYLE